jgi:hypothetical protein
MIPKNRNEGVGLGREIEIEGKPARVSNRIVVQFKERSGERARSAQELIESVHRLVPEATLVGRPSHTGRVVFAIDPHSDVVERARQLSNHPDVEFAEPDVIDSAQLIPGDTRYSEQWAYPKIHAPAAWDLTTGAATGVLIGIIDSGISMSAGGALNHPDLNDASRYILGTDFVDGGTPRDMNSHGTHVTGIAAAISNNGVGVAGMNWGTRVYVCRTLDANGNGSGANFASAVEEIVDFAVANGLKAVINYSGGGGASMVKQNACKYASDHGMILCAAAGNDNGGPIIWPAAYSAMFDGVIAVGSTDSTDAVSGFSNIGPELSVVAPGGQILSTTPTYAVQPGVALTYDVFDGTSMATPFVTGLCALMWSRHPSFSNRKIRDCLQNTALKLGPGNFSNQWGFGRIEAERALRCGDFSLPPFTRFTIFTKFTRFTVFTPFTLFTKFTEFTRFTRFTRFTEFTVGPGPGPDPAPYNVVPFIRFGGTVFSPEELSIDRFEPLAGVTKELNGAGIGRLDILASTDPHALAHQLGWSHGEAARLVQTSQQLMISIDGNR